MNTFLLLATLACIVGLELSAPSTAQNEIEIQNLRSMLEKATKQEDDTDIQNIDDVEGGVENLDSILAEMQDFPDDEQMNAQLHDMAANKQAPATAQLRVPIRGCTGGLVILETTV